MKFNKNGEKPETIKSNRNIRFDENGHIIVPNPSAYWIPNITTKQTIGGTEYTVVAEFVGDEPLHKKLERIFENDSKLSL